MTLFLASVAGPDEVEAAVAGGADIIDLKDPAAATEAALDIAAVRATVAAVAGRLPVSADAGGRALRVDHLVGTVAAMAEAGVDIVKVPLPAGARREESIRALAALTMKTKVFAVMFADHDPDATLAPLLADCGFAGAMLDIAGRDGGNLLAHKGIAALEDFIATLRTHGLWAGLAGALELPDIPRLLLLSPDVLGFRAALCPHGDRTQPIDAAAIAAVRALIPPDRRRRTQPAGDDVPADDADGTQEPLTDRVFVHDFVLPVRIGSYRHEHAKPQTVRFNVDVEVLRPRGAVHEMRDIFSYDIVTDGIRMIIAQEHIPFVEILAERIATLLLLHARVAAVTVRVEKLEIGPGAVGIEITRRAADADPKSPPPATW
jgi:dihydroneopterin aldolase